MALTPLHVHDVCCGSWASGGVCKYLDQVRRSDGKAVSVCTKLNSGAFADLEKKRKQRWGNLANGDNCQGYLYLQYKDQGYDVKK